MGKKRIKFVGVFLLLLLLGGCRPTTNRQRDAVLQQLAGAYGFTGAATAEGLSQPVRLRADKTAVGLALELLEPEEVAGLRVEFGAADTTLSYRGLVMRLASGDIPAQSLLLALREALAAMPEEGTELTEAEGLLTISGKAGLLPYSMVWSLEKCALIRIELPTLGGLIQVEKFEKFQ